MKKISVFILSLMAMPVVAQNVPFQDSMRTQVAPAPPQPSFDKRPSFPGGDPALFNFIKGNLTYPETAKRDRVGGTILVLFTINANGKLTEFALEKGVRKDLNDEAMRIVKTMPNWIPGSLKGKPVKVRYRMPLIFNPPPATGKAVPSIKRSPK